MAVITLVVIILFAYKYTLGALVDLLIQALRLIAIPTPFGTVYLAAPAIALLTGLNDAMYALLGAAIDANQWAWHRFVGWNAYVWDAVTGQNADTAVKTGAALHTLRRGTFPALLAKALTAATAQMAAASTPVVKAQTVSPVTITKVEKVTTTKIIEERPTTITRIQKVATAGAIPVRLPWANPWPRVKEVEHEADTLGTRVTNLAKRFSVAGIIGLVGATIFTRFGLDWLRCRGVNRVGRALCGLSGLIEELFLGAIAAMAISDLCTILTEAVGLVEEASPVFALIANGVDDLIGCQKAQRPPKLTVVAASLPAAQAYAALPVVG